MRSYGLAELLLREGYSKWCNQLRTCATPHRTRSLPSGTRKRKAAWVAQYFLMVHPRRCLPPSWYPSTNHAPGVTTSSRDLLIADYGSPFIYHSITYCEDYYIIQELYVYSIELLEERVVIQ